jgi:hypothetical protein
MPTLTNSATLAIGGAVSAVEEVAITVVPATSVSTGKGRLVHPTLGTLDYTHAPNSWTNIDGDVLPAPVWASSKTLQGSANTLWTADIRDVTVVERWTADSGGLKMKMSMLRTLLLFWQTPPDPASAWVLWYPTYTTDLSFKVLLTDLQVGGEGITLNPLATKKNWATEEVALFLKIVARNA